MPYGMENRMLSSKVFKTIPILRRIWIAQVGTIMSEQ